MNTKPVIAYHGDHKLKAELLAELEAHAEADQIIQGQYGPTKADETFRGCAVGCSIHSLNLRRGTKLEYDDFSGLAEAVGMTQALVHMEDTIFEHLPPGKAVQWPIRLMSAIEPGSDLSRVHIDLLIAIQERNLERLDVIAVLRDWRAGRLHTNTAWSAAKSAKSASWAAQSAAQSASWAARSAAQSAARSARSAARSAQSAEWAAEWEWMADRLIAILQEAV